MLDSGHGAHESAFHTDTALDDPKSVATDRVVSHPHSDAIEIPDAHLLFSAEFKRAGADLKLVGSDGKVHAVPGYFHSDRLATLLSPDGAALDGDIVAALAGPLAPGKYAALDTPQAAVKPIGHVAKIEGHATVVRNGVKVELNVGDVVLKGDVVETASDGVLALVFNDGSAFQIVHDSRLVLSEFDYDPRGGGGIEVFNLVQGSFSFASGKIAERGTMRIGTPVATMKIDGTAGGGDITSDNGHVTLYIFQQSDGEHKATILDQSGNALATLSSIGGRLVLTPIGPSQFSTNEQTKTDADKAAELAALQNILAIKNLGSQFVDALTTQAGTHGSSFVPPGINDQGVTGPGDGIKLIPVTIVVPQQVAGGNAEGQTQNNANTDPTNLPNRPPVAIADAYQVDEDGVLVVAPPGVLSNDSDPDGNTLKAVLVQGPQHGTLSFNDDGSLIYTPVANYHGIDTFTYLVNDGGLNSVPATATITVNSVNDAPVITSLASAAVGTVIEAGDLQPWVSEAGPGGLLHIDGAVAAAAAPVLAALDTHVPLPAPGFVVVTQADMAASITGVMSAAGVGKGTAIAVVWQNLDALYAAHGPNDVNLNAAFVYLGLEYASYVKAGGSPLVDVVAKYTADGGDAGTVADRVQSLHDNLLGNLTDAALHQRYDAAGLYGQMSGLVSAQDASLLTRPAVSGNETAPAGSTAAAGNAYDLLHGYASQVSGQLTASDADADDTAHLTWTIDTGSAYGSMAIDSATGRWTYTLDDSLAATQALGAGETKTETFVATVSDGHGGSASQTVTVTIKGTNDAPVITSQASAAAGLVVEAGDHQPFVIEAGPGGSLKIDGAVAAASASALLALDGALGSFAASPATGQAGIAAAIGGVMSDAHVDEGTAIAVLWQHLDAMYVSAGANQVNVNAAFLYLGLAYAAYVKAGGSPLVDVVAKYIADGGDVDLLADRVQSLHDNLLGNLTDYALHQRYDVAGLYGQMQALVSAQDASLLTRTVQAVGGYETDPAGSTAADGNAYDLSHGYASHVSGQLTAADVDTNDAGHLVWTIDTASAYGSMAIDSATGRWTYTLDDSLASTQALGAGDAVTETFLATVSDGYGGSASQTVTITVTGTNDAPTIVIDDHYSQMPRNLNAIESTPPLPLELEILNHGQVGYSFSDVDFGDSVALDATALQLDGWSPGGGGWMKQTTYGDIYIVYQPGMHMQYVEYVVRDALREQQVITENVIVPVIDSHGAQASLTLTFTATGTNDAPVVVTQTNATAGEIPGDSSAQVVDGATGTLTVRDLDIGDTLVASVTCNATALYDGSPVPAEHQADIAALLAPGAVSFEHPSMTSTGGDLALNWSYDPAAANLDWLAEGKTLTITYQAQVTDGTATITQPITITITGTNDAPAITSGATASVPENTLTSAAVYQIVATDPDSPSLTYSLSGDDKDLFDVSSNGAVTFKVSPDFEAPGDADQDNVYDIVVHVSDGITDTAKAVAITVTDVVENHAPVIVVTAAPQGIVTEDASFATAGANILTNGDFETGDLTGWIGSGTVWVGQIGFAQDGVYEVGAGWPAGTGSITQYVTTVANQHYTLDYWLNSGPGANSVTVLWNGQVVATINNVPNSPVNIEYTQEVVGAAGQSSLEFIFYHPTNYLLFDAVSLTALPGVEATNGVVSFADADAGDHHTASFTAQGGGTGYIGTFSLDAAVAESNGSGSVGWHFAANDADLQSLGAGQVVRQYYDVTIRDDASPSGVATTTVEVDLIGVNDAPTGDVTIGGTRAVGSTLTADTHTLADADGMGTLHYQWQRGSGSTWTNIGTQQTYTLTAGDLNNDIRVIVSYNDGYTNESVTSASVPFADNHAPVLTQAQAIGLGETLTKTSFNNIGSMANARNLDGHFGLGADADIDFSTAIPHVSIQAATSNNRMDFYKFTVTAGSRGIFDIDNNGLDSVLQLFDSNGNQIYFNDDGSGVTNDSNGYYPSYIDYTFSTGGTYYVAVGWLSGSNYNNISGYNYELQVSLENAIGNTTTVNVALENEPNNIGAPVNGVTTGTLISSIVDRPGGGGYDNVTDADASDNIGIALTHVDTSHGNWWYSTDSGAHWTAINAASLSTQALLLSGSSQLYFQPTDSFVGTINAAITFRAWDQSDGNAAGTMVTISSTGGATAFSTATANGDITVDVPFVVNDDTVSGGSATPPGSGWTEYNGHYYQAFTSSSGYLWSDANAAALATGGYLVTINSAGENTFVRNLAPVNNLVWLGGSDAAVQNTWVWVGGPETGQVFWNGEAGGSAPAGAYATWVTGEPNNWDGTAEDYLVMYEDGRWADFTNDPGGNAVYTYVVEYSASANPTEDAITTISAATLLANDTGTGLQITEVFNSANGAVVTLNNGVISYDPTHAVAIQALNAGQTMVDTFTYEVTDAHGNVKTATVSVNVAGVNHAPVLDASATPSLGSQSAAVVTNPVVNGSFDATLTGSWSTTGNAARSTSNSHSGAGDILATGATGGTVSQTLTTVVGQTYVLDFWIRASNLNTNGTNGNSFSVTANGQTIAPPTSVGQTGTYIEQTVSFVATSTSTTLQFTLKGGSGTGTRSINLDDVTVFAGPKGQVGTLVSSLVGNGTGLNNVADADTSDPTGIAITSTSGLKGYWFYTTDNGAHWNLFPAVDTTAALLLAADVNTRVFFSPAVSGSGNAGITFNAWDRSTGTNGGTANASVTGGTSAFSAASDIAMMSFGASPFTLTSGIDNVFYAGGTNIVSGTSANFTSADTIAGGSDTDTIQITDSGATVADTAFTHVTGIEKLSLNGGGTSSVTLAGNADVAIGTVGSFTVERSGSGNFTVNASALTHGITIDASGSSGNGTLKGGAGNDIIIGGSGADIINGGAGNDTLTGNGGANQFRFATNAGTDTVTNFVAGTDKIGLLDTGTTPTAGAVNFSVTGGAAGTSGTALASSDVVKRASMSQITASDDQKVILITSNQTDNQIAANIGTTNNAANNSYVVVFNSDANTAQIWFDTNWSNSANRVLVATLSGVTAAQINTMSAADFVAYGTANDPIVLDLNGQGIHFTSAQDGVQFDLDANGQHEQVAWTTGQEGILALDVNHNGVIDDGSEIFSPFFAGGSYADGLAALATLDSNGDGKIDAADAAFADLKVWQDLNHDGVSDPGELSGLADHGIASIALNAQESSDTIDGQSVLANGTFTKTDGTTGHFVEVAFETTPAPPPAPDAPAVLQNAAPAPDSFDFTNLQNSLVSNVATIDNFQSGVDVIHIGHELAGFTAGLAVNGTGDLAADLLSALNGTNFVANGAAEVTVNGGSNAGTYAVVNDGSAGFNAAQDAVIRIANQAVLHQHDFVI